MQKGLERCAHLQDSQQNYFKLKIDQLMGQRKVIQCLYDENADKRKKELANNASEHPDRDLERVGRQ